MAQGKQPLEGGVKGVNGIGVDSDSMPWSESVPAEIRLKPKAAEGAARMDDDPIIDIDSSAFRDDEE